MMSHLYIVVYVFFPPDRVIPLNLPSMIASLKIYVKISPTMKKMSGARGHPCLTPLSTLKLFLELSLMLIAADALPNRNLTQLMYF